MILKQAKKKMVRSVLFIYMLCTILLTACNTSSTSQDPIPEHETFTIYSQKLHEERVITIWKPSDYTTTTDSLPVLYMADGGLKEDFPHIANTLAQLISEGKVIPHMLVGIENTQRRRDLTGITQVDKDKEIAPLVGESQKFRSFIKEELFPAIQQRYRTKAQRSIIGESLAGLFVMETFFLHHDMFDTYIAFDPSLWWNDHALIKNAKQHLNTLSQTKKQLWFASSDATDIIPHTESLAQILEADSIPNLKWMYHAAPTEKHHTIFRATKEKALIWALGQ